MTSAVLFSAIGSRESIDAEKGIIFGVSVITEGEAKGKNSGTWIDKTTLSQFNKVASQFPDGVKVKLSEAEEHDGSVGQIIGSLKNFRTDGDKVRADLHLLKSDTNFAKILEMASAMPECFGLSAVLPKSLEKKDGKDFLRCEDIYSIDLVESPATNPTGLFSAKPQNTPMSEQIKFAEDGKTHAKDCDCKECMAKHSADEKEQKEKELSALTAAISELTTKVKQTEIKLAEFSQSTETAKLTAKKAEISALVAEASRDGKVIPLTEEQLCSMDTIVVKEMFSKLPANQIKLSGKRTSPAKPTKADGKPAFTTPDERIQFCRTAAAEGAAKLTADFAAQGLIQLN